MVYVSGGNELLNPATLFDHLGIKEGDRVADLGCGGAGHFIVPVARRVGESTTAYAVDILKSVLHNVMTKARSLGVKNIKMVWSDLERVGATRIQPESLDYSLLINTLYQSRKHREIFEEAKRLTKTSGKIVVVEWNKETGKIGPEYNARVSAEQLKETAQHVGLRLVEEFTPGPYHYGLIFTK